MHAWQQEQEQEQEQEQQQQEQHQQRCQLSFRLLATAIPARAWVV
jgi:hypothetical protein